jgi:hypothetical protein
MASWNQQKRHSASPTDKIAVVTSSDEEFLREKYNNDYYWNILKPRNVRQKRKSWRWKWRGRAEVVDLREECVCLLEVSCSEQDFRQRNDLSHQVNTIFLTACFLHPNPEHPNLFFFSCSEPHGPRVKFDTVPLCPLLILHDLGLNPGRRDSSMCITTGWTVAVGFPAGARDVYLLHSVQTAFGSHRIQWVPGALSSAVNRPGHEDNHAPATSIEVKTGGAIPLLPHTSSWRGA